MSPNPVRKNKPSAVRAKDRNKKIAIIAIILAIVIIIGAYFALTMGNPSNPNPSTSPSPSASPNASPTTYVAPKILMQTSMGNITIQLRSDKPITSQNFENAACQGVLDGTLFHRVIANFMIQGGMNTSLSWPEIPDEIGSSNQNNRGTISMANRGANTATTQFFINVVNNGNNAIDQAGTKFDTAYTTFGQVISGMDVVDAISHVAVGPNPYTGENSQPLQSVTLIKATVLP
jgi:peptidylprolyl isomerase